MTTEIGNTDTHEAELLLVLPVCVAEGPNGLLFEAQAARGIERYLESFSRVRVLCPLMTAADIEHAHSIVWKPVSDIAGAEYVTFVPLPYAMSLRSFMRAFPAGRSLIRAAIGRSQYLCFAIGGLFGDWGAVACFEAHRAGRPYAVWTDRVEHQVGLTVSVSRNPLRKIKQNLRARLMYSLEHFCIRHSTLGLFHGASCYSHYAPWCETSFLVQDFPAPEFESKDRQQSDALHEICKDSDLLTIAYVGRTDEMKGPRDWLEVMDLLRKRNVKFHATWLGDGSLLPELRAEVLRRKLEEYVSFRGFVEGRSTVFGLLHRADMFVFCHKTPESPRCLVEALISGCPIVGYSSAYASELIEHGGGSLVESGNITSLADRIFELNANRIQLTALRDGATPAGQRVLKLADIRYRSDLIKTYL